MEVFKTVLLIITFILTFVLFFYFVHKIFTKWCFKSDLRIEKKSTQKKIAKDFRPKLEIQKEQQKL